jgi:ABC-type Fe3+-hydroxamate transport system substrate-binding protein
MDLIDAIGQRHRPVTGHARIVSLVPSITELLFDLGLDAHIVGRTGFCIHPRQAVRDLPKVGGTKDVKLETLRALAPTHVIVNIDENEAGAVEAIRGFVPHVIVTHPNRPEDNTDLFRLLGGLFGVTEAAERLARELAQEIAACRAIEWPTERALYLIWKSPWMTIAPDTYIARTLALVGWQVRTAEGGWAGADRYPVVDDLVAAAGEVDRVLLSTEPYPFRDADVASVQQITQTRTSLIDAEMVSWYGSRAIRGMAYLRWQREQTLLRSSA